MKPLILSLPNKSKVAVIEKPHSFGVSIAINIAAGSFNEEGFPQGTAHFVEHMVFKGTTTRTAREINQSVNSVGGQLNAATGYEETKYFVSIPSPHWETAFEVIKDIVANPTFPEDELERERNVILEEIKLYSDDPVSSLMDSLQVEMFKDYQERQNILGTEESVKSITRDDLIRFVRTYYKPENMSFIAVGNIRLEDFYEKSSTYISSYEELPTPEKVPFIPYKMDSQIDIPEDTEQAHFAFVASGVDVNSKDATAFHVFSTILGANESSRLFQKIREEKGIAYSVFADAEFFSDYGSLIAYVGTNEEYFDEIEELILEEIRDIAENGVTEEELSTTISFLKGRTMLDLDNNTLMNDFLSHALTYGLSTDPLSQLEELDAVTGEDLKRVALELLEKDSYMTGTITPKYTIDHLED